MQSDPQTWCSTGNLREQETQTETRITGGQVLARIAGVDLPKRKRIEIGLTYIYGIGRTTSQRILGKLNIDPDTQTDDLSEAEINSIRKIIDNELKVEGELRTQVSMNIKRLMDLGCYRGLRHRKSLPVRGQRTSTNARTRKGPKRAAVKKKGGPGKK
jgi:small subunit ribosomal protein S13